MQYNNPIIRGYYPDPSCCAANGKFYLVNSSFQSFPGVPLFESDNLVNWSQIGHVLTRKSQLPLDHMRASGGIFAPTIRFHEGRFYMVTTLVGSRHQGARNFYVWTDDVRGEWSDPIYVDQGGIDPSLLFHNGKTYFISNGDDDEGVRGLALCEIDPATGEKLTPSRCVWQGTGGRYLEGPHLYALDGMYYLLASEGGTEYGHMITMARSESPWGPYEACPHNPVISNRNRAPYHIQGIGHGDLVQKADGSWYLVCLGFRTINDFTQIHHLGRETFLAPVRRTEDGWFHMGLDGTMNHVFDMPGDFEQAQRKLLTFENTDWAKEWTYQRNPVESSYELGDDCALLHGTAVTLNDVDSPSWLGIRQQEFCFELLCDVQCASGMGGLTLYMDENAHYDFFLRHTDHGCEAVVELTVGNIHHEQAVLPADECAQLCIEADADVYRFFLLKDGRKQAMDWAATRYISTEVAGGFTGVFIALFAVGGDTAFRNFRLQYL